MKNIMLKKVAMMVSAGCLGMTVSVSQAAPLTVFTNGTAADATEVNGNFTELETRITNISLTPGPTGPQGPAGLDGANGVDGAQGPAGADGFDGATGPAGADGFDGITGPAGADGFDGATGPAGAGWVTYSWTDYSSVTYASKTFSHRGGGAMYETLVQDFLRTPNGDGTGTTVRTNTKIMNAPSGDEIVEYTVDTFIWDSNGGDLAKTQRDTYYDPDLDGIQDLYSTVVYDPPNVTQKGDMSMGAAWGNGHKEMTTTLGNPDIPLYNFRMRTLLGIEDVTVAAGPFTNCLRILHGLPANSMSWHCPNGVGLVKQVWFQIPDLQGTGPGNDFDMLEVLELTLVTQ